MVWPKAEFKGLDVKDLIKQVGGLASDIGMLPNPHGRVFDSHLGLQDADVLRVIACIHRDWFVLVRVRISYVTQKKKSGC